MKKLILSRALKQAIAPEMLKEIYHIICELPTSGVEHHFCISPDGTGTILIHSIPMTNFHYTLIFSIDYGVKEDTNVIAFDNGDTIMMALSSEIKT